MKYIISACLVGVPCRYNGSCSHIKELHEIVDDGDAIFLCPEIMAGLQTPRISCEINKQGEVVDVNGDTYTKDFLLGVDRAMMLVRDKEVEVAILQSRSPTCGCGKVYDGLFSGNLIEGDGLFTQALKRDGITCVSEDEFLQNYDLGSL
ncbi:MAG: DUF523 domain-containing protein [Prolixibacteraceae bacterium]|jgi:uncharacterized protein YbbK (DUF523 family)|nr:DUF523 domain-containing protein [Prolixibacteraceae bacterium]